MTTKTTTKPRAGKKAKAAKPLAGTPAKGAKTLYRVCEATEGRQLIGDFPSADAATRKAKAYLAKHGVPVEVARGRVTGSTFQAEFTDTLRPEPTADGETNARVAAAAEPVESANGELIAAPAAKPKARGPRARKAKPVADGSKKASALDAAALVLAGTAEPMTAPDLVKVMADRKLWASPGGKTPAATLSAAIGREIKLKGDDARFKKTGRGRFAAR
jgi:hypothetical protein